MGKEGQEYQEYHGKQVVVIINARTPVNGSVASLCLEGLLVGETDAHLDLKNVVPRIDWMKTKSSIARINKAYVVGVFEE